MSDRVLAIIRIGGRLDPAFAQTLFDAIVESRVFARGDTYFEPRSIEDLVGAVDDDGTLRLVEDSAPWGEMPSITRVCQGLGLSYRLWHEAVADTGPEVVWWYPGMDHPEAVPADHLDPDAILLDARIIVTALEALGSGDIDEVTRILEAVVTEVEVPMLVVGEAERLKPEVPPFETTSRGSSSPLLGQRP